MLKFNEYLTESQDAVIDVDSSYVKNNYAQINAELDALTSKPYQNAPILLTQLRGCLERYGILIPNSATRHFMDLGAELVYMLTNPEMPTQGLGKTHMPAPVSSDCHLYIVYDTNDDGYVDGYAQLVEESELRDLLGMDSSELLDRTPHNLKFRSSTSYAKKEDDGGDTSEYA